MLLGWHGPLADVRTAVSAGSNSKDFASVSKSISLGCWLKLILTESFLSPRLNGFDDMDNSGFDTIGCYSHSFSSWADCGFEFLLRTIGWTVYMSFFDRFGFDSTDWPTDWLRVFLCFLPLCRPRPVWLLTGHYQLLSVCSDLLMILVFGWTD